MIEYIEGSLVGKNPTLAVVDCQGVGYALFTSLHTFSKLPEAGQRCKLLAHLQIKEDAHTLYGFITQEERHLFRLLISVSGVGATTAQMMLSAMTPMELISHIANGQSGALQAIKGIGAKTAQRIIIELRDKIGKTGISIEQTAVGEDNNNIRNEALSALTLLGFSRPIAEKAIHTILKASDGSLTVESLIKEALKIL
ncbi:MAG: Holliday junction branch migration protein RuvA [Lentimicrobiaceae bacterium]|nr:Holliday junction branch migration protein RuvA [Lentimicrobiaceae bacterium]